MGLQALSPMESKVFTLWREGKRNKEIAEAIGTTPGSVRFLKSKVQQKLAAENANTFVYQKGPGAELNQKSGNNSVKNLSPTEQKVFSEMEVSQKNYRAIANKLGTTEKAVKTLAHRIKKKLGPDYHKLFENKTDVTLKTQEVQESQQCENCLRYMGIIYNNGSKTIACQVHNQMTFGSNEPQFCQNYKRYTQTKYHEKDLLEERLNDKGFLKIAFERSKEKPATTETKLLMSVNSAGHQDYIFKKRAESLKTLIAGSRYAVVPLTTGDLKKHAYVEEYIDEETLEVKRRTRYPIKDFLEWSRLKPAKSEVYDEDENGNPLSCYYYIMKDRWAANQVFKALSVEE
jgi:DNA-binding CsgD family transcriptional regulator